MADNTQPATAPRRAQFDRHLVIVHRAGWQAIDDWARIGRLVRRAAPNVRVFVASDDHPDPRLAEAAAELPTLVVSPGRLHNFKPLRGRIYQGGNLHKLVELQKLVEGGVRIPISVQLTPDFKPDPKRFGPLVILKPLDLKSSSRGFGVQLMRTERVRYKAPDEYPEGHPGRLGPMLVQQFINTGPQPSVYRVTTLLGVPLYCYLIKSTAPPIDYSASDEVLEAAVVASQSIASKTREFVYEADVMALARAVHEAVPDVPLKGIDIMRDARTGRLYVLEFNAGGNTWHFSSNHLAGIREEFGPEWVAEMHGQLDAFGTAAQVLAERTLAEAE